jgi:hypothetical protein
MISPEDMKRLQEQLIELSDENLDLRSRLEAEQAKAMQTPLIKSRLAAAQKALADETRRFEKAGDAIRAQYNPQGFSHMMKSLGQQVGSKIARPVDRVEELTATLALAESRLADDTELLSTLIETEAHYIEHLSTHAVTEDDLLTTRDELKTFIAKYQMIEPDIRQCCGIPMALHDLAGRLERIQVARAAQRGRRNRLMNWMAQTVAINEHQGKALQSMVVEFEEAGQKVVAREVDLANVQSVLGSVIAEKSQAVLLVAAEEDKIDRIVCEVRANAERRQQERIETERRIADMEKLIATLRHDVETHHVSKRKLLQKKLDMIQQLTKRLAQERKTRDSIDVGSTRVEELAQEVSAQMLEKQGMLGEVRKREEQLKWLQAETQKKSVIIKELKTMTVSRTSDRPTPEQAVEDFDGLVNDVEVQNEGNMESLQKIGRAHV